ncbi:MAG: hypothetical protein RL094_175 [Candidatus Parcubacteria bacterium]|jgi:ribonuclease HI
MNMKEVTIFTDGASRGNPGPGGWAAVTVFPDAHGVMHVDELGGREALTTNNRMEMMAALKSLQHFDGFYENFKEVTFTIFTDSSYLLNGATKWVFGWVKNNWKTGKEEVKNRDIWEGILKAMEGKHITWKLLKGHSGVPGNERCDVISTEFADEKDVELYKGTLSAYGIKYVMNTSVLPVSQTKKKSSSSEKAYSYVSLVDGNIETHTNWGDCEKRVKGASKARFKKSFSKEDEAAIIADFLQK